MSTIAETRNSNFYHIFMEPPKDSQKIHVILQNVRENTLEQDSKVKRFCITTGYAILVWATAFFETISFSGKCLQTCIVEIWYISFSDVKEHLKRDSENIALSLKYVLVMPFIIFAGMFSPEKVYAPLDYPYLEIPQIAETAQEIQDLRDALEAERSAHEVERIAHQSDNAEKDALESELDVANQDREFQRHRAEDAESEAFHLRDTENDLRGELQTARANIEITRGEQNELIELRVDKHLKDEAIHDLEDKIQKKAHFELAFYDEKAMRNETIKEVERLKRRVQELTQAAIQRELDATAANTDVTDFKFALEGKEQLISNQLGRITALSEEVESLRRDLANTKAEALVAKNRSVGRVQGQKVVGELKQNRIIRDLKERVGILEGQVQDKITLLRAAKEDSKREKQENPLLKTSIQQVQTVNRELAKENAELKKAQAKWARENQTKFFEIQEQNRKMDEEAGERIQEIWELNMKVDELKGKLQALQNPQE